MYNFRNDYSEGAHPAVLAALAAHNGEHVVGYGADQYCARAAQLIRDLCRCPGADVQFLIGGTQTNFTAVAAFLRPWEGVICAHTGHVNGHEGGAVEATGHKLLQAQAGPDGKLTPELILPLVEEGRNEHVVLPRLVYISDATENGAVYTLAELEALSSCCRANGLLLFLDGARLGAAFGAAGNDLTLPDLARLTDAFYIGGTKNGALFGEALVLLNDALKPDFRYNIKQRGGMLAKGWLLGIQFEQLMQGDRYVQLAAHANAMALKLKAGIAALGYPFACDSVTNQQFPILPDGVVEALKPDFGFEFSSKPDAGHTCIRLVTSWATPEGNVDAFLAALKALS